MAEMAQNSGGGEIPPGAQENIVVPSGRDEEDTSEVDKWIPEGKDPSIYDMNHGLFLKEIPERDG